MSLDKIVSPKGDTKIADIQEEVIPRIGTRIHSVLSWTEKHALPLVFGSSLAFAVGTYAFMESKTSSHANATWAPLVHKDPWAYLDDCTKKMTDGHPEVRTILEANRSVFRSMCLEHLVALENPDAASVEVYFKEQFAKIRFAPDSEEKFFSIWALVTLMFFLTAYPLAYFWTMRKQLIDHTPINSTSFAVFATGSTLWSLTGFHQGSEITGMGYAILAGLWMLTVGINEFMVKRNLRSGKWQPNVPGSDGNKEALGAHVAYVRTDNAWAFTEVSEKFSVLLPALWSSSELKEALETGISEVLERKTNIHRSHEIDFWTEYRVYQFDFEPILEGEQLFGACVVANDVTESYRDSKIIHHSPSPTVTYSKTGHILTWNRAMEELTGYTREDMDAISIHTGKTPMEILYRNPNEYEKVTEYLRMIESGQVSGYKNVLFTLTRKDGTERSALWTTSAYAWGSIRSAVDVTDLLSIQSMILKDQLVNCWSLKAFEKDFAALFPESGEISRRRRNEAEQNRTHALVALDFDGFKQVNDTYWHLVGDALLRAFGDIVRAEFRDTDSLYRIWGDEFLLLARDTEVESFAKRFESFSRKIASMPLYVHSKTGIYGFDEASVTGEIIRLPGIRTSAGAIDFAPTPEARWEQELPIHRALADELLYASKCTKHLGEGRVLVCTVKNREPSK